MCTPSTPDIAVDAAKHDAPIAGLPVARKTPPATRFLAARPALILLLLYRVDTSVISTMHSTAKKGLCDDASVSRIAVS
jgi:hypothetical protein